MSEVLHSLFLEILFPFHPTPSPKGGIKSTSGQNEVWYNIAGALGGYKGRTTGSTSSVSSQASGDGADDIFVERRKSTGGTAPSSSSNAVLVEHNSYNYIPFGPISVFDEVLPVLILCVAVGFLFGLWFTRKRPARRKYGRTDLELWYIVAHNSIVVMISVAAWACGSRTLALVAFCFEISYEVFDSWAL